MLGRDFIVPMLKSLKKKFSQRVLGETIKDWGVVFEQQPGFFREQIRVGLHQKDRQLILCLTYKYTSKISLNVHSFAIPVFDLGSFVTTLQSNYDQLCDLARSSHPIMVHSSDKLPFAQRMMIKVIHGLRASKLLLDHQNPVSNKTEFRFYGYVTRKSSIKIFIQSDIDLSQSEGHVISGKGFEAVLQVLSEYLRESPGRCYSQGARS